MARPTGSNDKHKRKSKSFWLLGEEELLVSHCGNMTAKQLSILLNKSKSAILNKLRQLGIHRIGYKSWYKIPDDIALLNGKTGVYALYNTITYKYYIGSSSDIGVRLYNHIMKLRKNKHENKSLQLEYSEPNFCVLLLKQCDDKDLIKLEEQFIKLLRGYVYNTYIQCVVLPPIEIIKDKFWKKVIVTDKQEDCWLWTGVVRKNDGYGSFSHGRHNDFAAHRIAYYIHYQKNPNGYFVRHKCHNKLCCNPHHLELGSHMDNMRDSFGNITQKGPVFVLNRPPLKESLLLPHKEEIKQLRAQGCSYTLIGNKYGVKDCAVYKFVCKHLPEFRKIPIVKKEKPKKLPKKRVVGATIDIFGETKRIVDWLCDERCVASNSVFRMRLAQGWQPEDALTTPMRERTKIPKEWLQEVLGLRHSGKTQKEVGLMFGVSGPTIGWIWKNNRLP